MKQTTLRLVRSNDISGSIHRLNGEYTEYNNIVLGLAPDPPMCCCSCKIVIPSGVVAVVQEFGVRQDEETPPGPYWC